MKQTANLSSLTDEQRAAFAKVNALLGLGADEVTYSAAAQRALATTASRAQEAGSVQPLIRTVLSSDATESHVPPHFVPVGSVAELRKITSNDAANTQSVTRQEDEHLYPEPLSAQEKELLNSQPKMMKPDMSPELRARIEKAATAYVMLDPSRVSEYEPLINATLFPGQVAAFVSDDLEVQSGEVYRITGDGTNPVVVNFANVTVHSGGSIEVDVNCSFTCQTFTQL